MIIDKEKKQYEQPIIEIYLFETLDIVTASDTDSDINLPIVPVN